MRASDIEPGKEYLVGQAISRRYGAEGKAVVVRAATEADKARHRDSLRGVRLAKGSGHKLWLVRWEVIRKADTFDRIEAGQEAIAPSAWFRQEWTADLDQEDAEKAANRAASADLAQRLEKALPGIRNERHRWRNEDDPVFVVSGRSSEHPSFEFTKPAIEALLAQIERA